MRQTGPSISSTIFSLRHPKPNIQIDNPKTLQIPLGVLTLMGYQSLPMQLSILRIKKSSGVLERQNTRTKVLRNAHTRYTHSSFCISWSQLSVRKSRKFFQPLTCPIPKQERHVCSPIPCYLLALRMSPLTLSKYINASQLKVSSLEKILWSETSRQSYQLTHVLK